MNYVYIFFAILCLVLTILCMIGIVRGESYNGTLECAGAFSLMGMILAIAVLTGG